MVTLPARLALIRPGTAEQRLLPEMHRVQELVVDPPVDHVHRLEPGGGPHHHPTGPADQVAALDQLDAHHPGQQGMLEVGGVVDTGGQHHHPRVTHPGRRGRAQRGQQPPRVAVHRTDPVVGEHLGQRAGHRPAVGHHVGDPGRHPDVVLEHPEVALGVPDQVDARDVHPNAVDRLDVRHLAQEVRAGGHHVPGHDAVGEKFAGVVDVVEERFQGPDPLLDAGLHLLPGVRVDQPGHDVQRERPLDAADREGDALVEVGRGQEVGPGPHLLGRHRAETCAGCPRNSGGPGAPRTSRHGLVRRRGTTRTGPPFCGP